MKFILQVFIFVLALCTGLNAVAQKKAKPGAIDKDTLGVFVNSKNQKVYMFGMFQVTQESINYKTNKGVFAYESINKIKWAKMGDRYFLAYRRGEKEKHKNLMEITAMNDKYILMRCYESFNGRYYNNYYIYDYKGDMMAGDTYDYAKDVKIQDTLKKYIGDCPAFIKQMEANKKHEKFILSEINAVSCPGAPKIETLMQKLEKEEWKEK